MADRADHYRTLQVDPAANPLVIQAAYRVLARIFHPDVQGDDEQMKRLNRSWEVLGDPAKRAAYDIERAGRHPGPTTHATTTSPITHPRTSAPPPAGARTADVRAAFAANTAGRSGATSTGAAAASGHAGSGNASASLGSAGPDATPSSHSTTSSTRASEDHAGPPRGEPYGPVLKFGRYEGWSVGQVARVDQPFLEWLRRVPAGRAIKDEIDAVLRSTGISGVDRRRYDSERQKVHTWAPGAPTKLR